MVRGRELFSQLMTRSAAPSGWTRGVLSAILGLTVVGAWQTTKRVASITSAKRGDASEPGLFKKQSTFESFTTQSGTTYPRIRVFYHPHPQAGKLPKNLPLLVFIHGLGGTATQFSSLLTGFVNVAPCLAIDLPGCGLSDFKPDDPKAYTTAAFAELIAAAIDRYRNKDDNQQVVLIGHSMGCSIGALLASSISSLQARLSINYIIAFIAICPKANPPSEREAVMVNRLRWLPAFVLDIMRVFDRRGGLNSTSVTRVVGDGADVETRKLQQRYNRQSRSAVVLRFLTASIPAPGRDTRAVVSWPGKETWSGVKVPLFLLTGEADKFNPPDQIEQIVRWLTEKTADVSSQHVSEDLTPTAAEQRPREIVGAAPDQLRPDGQQTDIADDAEARPATTGDMHLGQLGLSNQDRPAEAPERHRNDSTHVIKDDQKSTKHNFVLKTAIFPAPAAHGLMYDTSTVRTTSGLIAAFLSKHVDERLSPGWQLQHLTTSGKWDVKNLKKWQSVQRCSDPIAGVFRAMKTMREVDDTHNPTEFVKQYSYKVIPDGVAMIVDISHESPVYDPKGLEDAGVEYHKFPTVSKLPPTLDEVAHFISLIDHLRRSPKITPTQSDPDIPANAAAKPIHPTIGAHCRKSSLSATSLSSLL